MSPHRLALPALLFLLAFVTSAHLQAQFRDPTPDELKMTVDPKAPDAAAVYLNVEEKDDDALRRQTIYARIKILAEAGKKLATVELPYIHGDWKIPEWKITNIKARTIHADGKIFPLDVEPSDLLTFSNSSLNVSRKIFLLPHVEVGSILEYSYEIHFGPRGFSGAEWDVQKDYFVHEAHYSYTTASGFRRGRVCTGGLLHWERLPKGVVVVDEAHWRYTLDMTDISPIPYAEWMPPVQSFLYKVVLSNPPGHACQASDIWNAIADDWNLTANSFANTDSKLKSIVAQTISPSDSNLVKAQKLYRTVQQLENTSFTRRKSSSEMKVLKIKEAATAEDVWQQKGGSRNEIALFYLALLRAANLKAHAVQLANRNINVFDPSYMSLDQLDDVLVDLDLGGQNILLDPGEKLCPFGIVHWHHSGVRGLAQTNNEPFILSTPDLSYKNNNSVLTGSLALDANGNVAGAVQYIMTGQNALRWRQFAFENDPEETKNAFDKDLEQILPPGVSGHVDHFLGLDNPDVNLLVIVNIRGKLGTVAGRRMILPALLFESAAHHPFVNQPSRQLPIEMNYAEQTSEQIDYHLPVGFSVEGVPKDTDLVWPDHASYIFKTRSAPGLFTSARRLIRTFSRAIPEEYHDLRSFYQKVATSDLQQLVLTAPRAAKGN